MSFTLLLACFLLYSPIAVAADVGVTVSEEVGIENIASQANMITSTNAYSLASRGMAGVPVSIGPFQFSLGPAFEAKIGTQSDQLSMFGNRSAWLNSVLYGGGAYIRFTKIYAMASVLFLGEQEWTARTAQINQGGTFDRAKFGNPVNTRISAGFEVANSIYLHGTAAFSSFNKYEYVDAITKTNNIVDLGVNPMQAFSIAVGISVFSSAY